MLFRSAGRGQRRRSRVAVSDAGTAPLEPRPCFPVANQILVGLLGGSGAKDCGGSMWWAVGFWRWRSVSSCGFQAMEINAFLWVSDSGDQLGFWVSRLVCCGGGL